MRGHLSGNREPLPFSAGDNTAENDSSCVPAVRADFNGSFPVGPAELDAFEAFLMPQILALLHEKNSPDSEAPQRLVRVDIEKRLVGAGNEVFVEEAV